MIFDFTVTADGTLWVASGECVGRWDGAGWTVIDSLDVFDPERTRLGGMGVDADGRLFVMTTDRLRVRWDGRWRDVDVGDPPDPSSLAALLPGPDRSLMLLTARRDAIHSPA